MFQIFVDTKRPSWDEFFLQQAKLISARATCPRLHVGAVVTSGNILISSGYNGAPKGQPHCTDVGCAIHAGHCIRTIHAETNALLGVGYSRLAGPLTLYVSVDIPCVECCKLTIQAGVGRVVVPKVEFPYYDNRLHLFGAESREELLERAGVKVVRLEV